MAMYCPTSDDSCLAHPPPPLPPPHASPRGHLDSSRERISFWGAGVGSGGGGVGEGQWIPTAADRERSPCASASQTVDTGSPSTLTASPGWKWQTFIIALSEATRYLRQCNRRAHCRTPLYHRTSTGSVSHALLRAIGSSMDLPRNETRLSASQRPATVPRIAVPWPLQTNDSRPVNSRRPMCSAQNFGEIVDRHARAQRDVNHRLVHALGVHVNFHAPSAAHDAVENRFPKIVAALRHAAFAVNAERHAVDGRARRSKAPARRGSKALASRASGPR